MSKPIANPYVGPRAFEEGEGARFFGRDRELAKLLNLLIARRLVLLHAPSGAGKTSLIQAALIPRLRDEGFVVRRSIRVHAEVPPEVVTLGPNRYLLSTLTALDEEVPPAQRSAPADLAQISLTRYLDQRRSDGDVDEVLIFDQFEEVLTADTTDRAAKDAFLAELGAALEDPHRWALFAIREDYLGQLRPLLVALPTRLDTLFRLDLLDPAHARRAVQEPAHTVGGNFRDEAAAKLIDDLRQTSVQRPDGSSEVVLGQSIEPMQLQVVCYRLWERKTGDRRQEAEGEGSITVEDLAEAGDVDTALRDYYAEQVAATAHASGVDERRIRDWVEENLITESGLRGQVLRAPDATGGLANTVIRRLVDAHLVRAEDRRGVTWYELAHDRLIAPVRQDNMAWFEANLSTLQRQARLWDRANRPDGLLLRGEALRHAERDLREPELSESERAFLAECRAVREAEERERRQSRRIRLLAWISSFGGVIALVLAGIAWSFYGKANTALGSAEQSANQARTAEVNAVGQANVAQTAQARAVTAQADAQSKLRTSESHRLAIAARSQFSNNSEVGLLLAYEANACEDNRITEQTLRDGLDAVSWIPTLLHGDSFRGNNTIFNPDGTRILTVSGYIVRMWDANGQPLAALKGHINKINSVVLSPDGMRILTASEDFTARLWDANGKPLATLKGHGLPVNSAVFSPDGTRILTASTDGTARLWDANGQPLTTFFSHTDEVNSAVFSPDGTRILTASNDHTARLWDTSGHSLVTLSGHTNVVTSAVFSPDGTRILTSSDGTARLWDAQGQPLTILQGNRAVFSPDGSRILTTLYDTAQLWGANGQPLTTLSEHTNGIKSAVFSPDGTRILTSGDDTARLWDAVGHPLGILQSDMGRIDSAVFSPDSRHILTFSNKGIAQIWDEHDQSIAIFSDVGNAKFSSDGMYILTSSRDGAARLWDNTGKPLVVLPGTNDAIFSPDSTHILSVSRDGTLQLWNVTGQPIAMLKDSSGSLVSAVAFSSDGTHILVVRGSGSIEQDASVAFSSDGTHIFIASIGEMAQLWNAQGQLLATLKGHTDKINNAVFSPDGTHVLTASADGMAHLWNTQGQLLATLKGHTGSVTSAVFSSDGTYILTASTDKTARLWNIAGQPLATLNHRNIGLSDHQNSSAVFSPNVERILIRSNETGLTSLWNATGQRLAILESFYNNAIFNLDGSRILTASWEYATLWDAQGNRLKTFTGHTGTITSAVFSPDGRLILTASFDETVRLWDVQGHLLTTFIGHTAPVNSAVFSPDGTRILTTSQDDGTARLYLVRREDLRRAAACRVGRGLTDEEVARFQVPTPLAFDFEKRQCPPVYSWQQGTK